MGGENEAVPSVEIGHQTRPRRPSRLWYLPRSAFDWQTEFFVFPMRSSPENHLGTCKICGEHLRLTYINYEAALIKGRRRRKIAAVAWSIFSIMLIATLGYRSPSTWLITADVIVGVVSVVLLLDWLDNPQIWTSDRWRGHRLSR